MLKKIIILSLAFIVSSCAEIQTEPPIKKIVVKTDAISSPDADTKKTYILMPGSKDVNPTDLKFLLFSKYVEKGLAAKGFIRKESFNDAEIVVYMSYGIGNPSTYQYSYSVPVWGQTGTSSSRTTGNINSYGSYGAIYTGTTTYTPTYGVTGHNNVVESYDVYTRFLVLDAYDLGATKQDNSMRQIWKVNVTSSGRSSDLRYVMPYMVVGSSWYYATNTPEMVITDVGENNPEVIAIRE